VDFAVLTRPVWWLARQWLRFLTGLAIIAVALGPVRLAAVTVQAAPAVTVDAAPAAIGVAPVAGVEPLRPAIASGVDRTTVDPDLIVDRAPIAVPQAPVRVQRPAHLAEPASADVAPVGPRAPPAAASPL
jgi:hypothetical protein